MSNDNLPPLRSEIHEYLIALLNEYSPFGANNEGWRQVSKDMTQIYRDLCRSDACGRLSKRDITLVDSVIAKLRAQGKTGPLWSGYPTKRENH